MDSDGKHNLEKDELGEENNKIEGNPKHIHEIGYPYDMSDILAIRFPDTGSVLFMSGSIINVRDGQQCIVCHDGQVIDVFLSGRNILNFDSFPFLKRTKDEPFPDEKILGLELYFLSTREYLGKWGTAQPIVAGNRNLENALIQGFGIFTFCIEDTKLFANHIFGKKYFSLEHVCDLIRIYLLSALLQTIGKYNQYEYKSVFDIINNPKEISDEVQLILTQECVHLGIKITGFTIASLKPCEASLERLGIIPGNQNTQHSFSVNGEEVIMGDKYETGQAGAVGPKSHAHDMEFSQIWEDRKEGIDLDVLASELRKLRSEMRENLSTPDQEIALGEVALAQVAAEEKNGKKVIEHLSKVGKWVLDTATRIGVRVAADVIMLSMGQSPGI